MKVEKLKALDACGDAVAWTKTQPNAKIAWAKCQHGDWMLWFIGRTTKSKPWSDGRKLLLSACLECADLVANLRPKAQAEQIAGGISVLRDWIAGKTDQVEAEKAVSQIRKATYAIYADAADAADAAIYADAAAAADAATDAADATDATDAADAADAAAAYAAATYAAADAATDAARKKVLAQCADIVRKHFPHPPKL